MQLLEQAAHSGWTAELKEKFVHAYDRQIGRSVLTLLAQYGLISSARELSLLRQHIELRLEGKAKASSSERVDLLCDVYVKTYHEVFQERFVKRWLSQDHAAESSFERYLHGLIRHQFFAALGKEDLSEKELLDRIVQSKRAETKETHLREAKSRLWERARAALLCVSTHELVHHHDVFVGATPRGCPQTGQAQGPAPTMNNQHSRVLEPQEAHQLATQVDRHIDAITHYFFECFLPERYPQLMVTAHGSSFERLLESFRQEHYRPGKLSDEILNYRGRLSRRPPVRLVAGVEEDEGDDQ
ncbi:hypothetical protein HYR54_17045 [Candidatus Acetothermia bacterium]|nr:hypothetical protein [Candidatus Acetothermia bacterium]